MEGTPRRQAEGGSGLAGEEGFLEGFLEGASNIRLNQAVMEAGSEGSDQPDGVCIYNHFGAFLL